MSAIPSEATAAAMPQMRPLAPTAPMPVAGQGMSIGAKLQREHRIHVEGASLFIDAGLVLHRAELDPANETALRRKLALTFSLNEPSFYESPERRALALHLGQLIPVGLPSKHAAELAKIEEFNLQVKTGIDAHLQEVIDDKHAPMTALMREEAATTPDADPIAMEVWKNGVAIYVMLHAKLGQKGFVDAPEAHVKNWGTSDQILGDLQQDIGITPLQLREAAAKGGLKAVGALLGLGDRFVDEVRAMADDAALHRFSSNRLENWIMGIGAAGMDAPLEKKLSEGLKARVEGSIPKFRAMAEGVYRSPEPKEAMEKQVAEWLNILPPQLLQAMDALGYEVCYTPSFLADKIAFFDNIFGLNRTNKDHPGDIRGTYRIYFSGHDTLENRLATLVHEAHHILFPALFTAEQVTAINTLLERDNAYISHWSALLNDPAPNPYGQTAFEQLKALVSAYQAAQTPQDRAHVVVAGNTLFAPYGVTLDAVLPALHDVDRFRLMMDKANRDLRIEGERYTNGGYDDTPSRLREIISRYAELKYVRLKDDPSLMSIIAPGMNEINTHYYLPHLTTLVQKIHAMHAVAANDAHVSADQAVPMIDPAQVGVAIPAANEPKEEPKKPLPALVPDVAPTPEQPPAAPVETKLQPALVLPMSDTMRALPAANDVAPLPPSSVAAAHSPQCAGCAACRAGQAVPSVQPSLHIDLDSLNQQGRLALAALHDMHIGA